jgi:hypothetical protein
MPLLLLLLLFADPWTGVRELKPGGDVRVYKTGEKKPVAAKFDSASEDALVLVLKSGQVSIPKSRIERVEYRAPQPGRVSMQPAGRWVPRRRPLKDGRRIPPRRPTPPRAG